MSTEQSPMVNKLILLVLVLILGCLVVLVAQNAARWSGDDTSQMADNAGAPIRSLNLPADETYLPLTNRAFPRTSAQASRPGSTKTTYRSGSPFPEGAEGVSRTAIVATENPAGSAGQTLSPFAIAVPVGVVVDAVNTLTGAELTGHVLLAGAPPPEKIIQLDATCGKLQTKPLTTRHFVVNGEGHLANVLVYIATGLNQKSYPVPSTVPVLENVGCLFEPYVMGVQTNQKFRIKNSDLVLHNVHATSQFNKEFNLAMPLKGQSVEKSFPLPEVMVRLKCDVHPWMFAYVGVVPHPFFAVTDTNGVFKLPAGLPPGSYTLNAYHPKGGVVSQEITIREGERKNVDFTLSVPSLAAP